MEKMKKKGEEERGIKRGRKIKHCRTVSQRDGKEDGRARQGQTETHTHTHTHTQKGKKGEDGRGKKED